ncbi:hypothetical protein HK102_013324 [Quaeritorhiza haematococci]|nr:hypothetical protein HK102_013324 [Quaeritorhiza haematococci]
MTVIEIDHARIGSKLLEVEAYLASATERLDGSSNTVNFVEIYAAQSEVESIEAEQDQLQVSINEQGACATELKAEIQRLENEIQLLKNEIRALEERLRGLSEELSNLRERLDVTESRREEEVQLSLKVGDVVRTYWGLQAQILQRMSAICARKAQPSRGVRSSQQVTSVPSGGTGSSSSSSSVNHTGGMEPRTEIPTPPSSTSDAAEEAEEADSIDSQPTEDQSQCRRQIHFNNTDHDYDERTSNFFNDTYICDGHWYAYRYK